MRKSLETFLSTRIRYLLCHVELEDLPHILLSRCHLLRERANYLTTYLSDTLSASPTASFIARNILNSEDDHLKVQFFLDPTVIPEIIAAAQSEPNILSLVLSVTTTWCYSMNRERIKLLGK